jgi:dihydroorotate dehydrogenase
MYRLLRNILFWFDAESVHYFSMNSLKFFCSFSPGRNLLRRFFRPKGTSLKRTVFGLEFSNPVGLAAGFDKNARYLRELEVLGFGFVEIGTVTPVAQEGNPKPRLFRLPKDKAIINRMGFNNDGVVAVSERLFKFRHKEHTQRPGPIGPKMIIGGNIGKNKNTPNEEAWKDYATCFNLLYDVVDYFVVNVSSPNTPGLRELQQKDSLEKILLKLKQLNNEKQYQKPILLKISPDLSKKELDDIIELVLSISLDGIVASNTTINRNNLKTSQHRIQKIAMGGLSGKPLAEESFRVEKYILEKTKGKIPLISSGGIFTGMDAKKFLDAGASLIEVWTGFIYEGPTIVKSICKSF